MQLSNDQLTELHNNQLEILEEIQRICAQNNIEYFAIAGTLLGAIRHSGFIPWDDDIDLGMKRDQYIQFLSCAERELRPEFFLQTWSSDKNFGLPMAKIRRNGTRIVETASAAVECHQGIFVDIFPFDEKPDAPVRRLFHAVSAYVLKRALLGRSGYAVGASSPTPIRVAFQILSRAIQLIPTNKLIGIFERQMRQFNGSNSTELVTVAGSYGYRREALNASWIQDLVEYDFDGLRIVGFRDADAYLSKLYGDYSQLPPDDARGNRHDIQLLDFGSA